MANGRRQIETRALVSFMLRRGLSKGAIARWQAIQRYYDEGHWVRGCIERFGFSRQTWHAAVKRGAVLPRAHPMPRARLLVADTYRSRHNVKLRLLGEGLKVNQCEVCGLTEWRGEPLSMALHHVNGHGLDNRLENLQLLCPNCHSQTENFAGRGRARLEVVGAG